MATASGTDAFAHTLFPLASLVTEADMQEIRTTWAVVFGSAEDNGKLIIVRFFTEYPESKKYFKSFSTDEELHRDRAVILHGKKVMIALDQIITNWNNPPRLEKLTKALTTSHRDKHGVPFEMFQFMFQSFLMVFQDHFSETFTKGRIAIWQKFFGAVQKEIQNAYISQSAN